MLIFLTKENTKAHSKNPQYNYAIALQKKTLTTSQIKKISENTKAYLSVNFLVDFLNSACCIVPCLRRARPLVANPGRGGDTCCRNI